METTAHAGRPDGVVTEREDPKEPGKEQSAEPSGTGPDAPRRFAALAGNKAGTWSLAAGVLALAITFLIFLFPFNLMAGVVALVLGVVGLRRVKRGQATNRGQAIGGVVIGAFAVFLGVNAIIFIVANREELAERKDCLAAADTDAQRDTCQERFEDQTGR